MVIKKMKVKAIPGEEVKESLWEANDKRKHNQNKKIERKKRSKNIEGQEKHVLK